jgi:hypothetical protein
MISGKELPVANQISEHGIVEARHALPLLVSIYPEHLICQ